MTAIRAFLLALAVSAPAFAATETLKVGQALPRLDLLKSGTHHYLRFVRQGESHAALDIWSRSVSIDGKSLRIRQRWDGNGSVRTLDSAFDAATFRPLTHERINDKDGKRTEERFRFADDAITDATGKAVPSPEPAFNFETDIELLQTLPLAKDYAASIVFYHPGGAAPARYLFKVTGEQSIAGPQGAVDCWVVTADYNRPGYVSTFWFAKATQVLVRQESPMPDGKVLVKTLID